MFVSGKFSEALRNFNQPAVTKQGGAAQWPMRPERGKMPLVTKLGQLAVVTPEEAANAIVHDTLMRRQTSFITTSDRMLAGIARVFPWSFAKTIKWWVEMKK